MMADTDKDARPARRPRRAAAPWDVWKLRPLPGEFTWTLEDAAGFLGISREAVHRMVKRGTLDARRVGGKPVIVVRDKDVRALPMSPQHRRQLILKGELPADGADLEPDLDGGLPEG